MIALLRADSIQLRTTRTALIFGLVILFLAVASAVGLLAITDRALHPSELLFAGGASFMILLLSVVAITGNYRHRVVLTEQLISPSTIRVILSKMIVYGVCGAMIALVEVCVLVGIIAVWPGAPLVLGSNWGISLLVVIAGGALAGVLGVAVARLIRSQVAAVITVVGYVFILGRLLIGLGEELHVPILTYVPSLELTNNPAHSAGVALLILVGFSIGIAGLAMLLDRRRDL